MENGIGEFKLYHKNNKLKSNSITNGGLLTF